MRYALLAAILLSVTGCEKQDQPVCKCTVIKQQKNKPDEREISEITYVGSSCPESTFEDFGQYVRQVNCKTR